MNKLLLSLVLTSAALAANAETIGSVSKRNSGDGDGNGDDDGNNNNQTTIN